MRTPILAGNWKMNKGRSAEAVELAGAVASAVRGVSGVEVVVCPPFLVLAAVRDALAGSSVRLGAQDCFWKTSGAYTGNVSPEMLADAGVSYVILGHSERRGRFGVPEPDFTPEILQHFGDTDATINRKAHAALGAGITPILCVGETLVEREAGKTDEIVRMQVAGALAGIAAEEAARIVFAYEPVWAIGTGKTCDANEADRVCGIVRATVAALHDAETADAVRIQYGGSMKPDNARELLEYPHIDGGLIGGASLKADQFAAVVEAARR